MKIKLSLLFFGLLFTFGFTKITKPSILIPEGKWIMCKTICNGIETTANVCTEITFTDNLQGEIRKPKSISNFTWKIKDEIIEFHFKNNFDKTFFISKDSILIYQFFDREKNIELQLEEENTKCKYILIKSKQ